MSSLLSSEIDAAAIVRFHERQLLQRDWPVLSHAPVRAAPWPAIEANHRYNGLLWQERERACRLDLPPAEVAACHELVARYDGKRAAARAAIDEALDGPRRPGVSMPGETVGALVDGLSALALQLHDVRSQAGCIDAGAEHAQACAVRLERLLAQRRASMVRLDALLGISRHPSGRQACREDHALFDAWRGTIYAPYLET
jgi:hypothetical protein